MNLKHKKAIIPIFVPHRGCPHDCVFCNQEKITGFRECIDREGIQKRIETYLSTMTDRHPTLIEVAYYGGSFTAIDADLQEAFLEAAHVFIKAGRIGNIRLSTRPDAIDEQVLTRLKKYGVGIIELGVQSMAPDVLKDSERGHLVSHVKDAVRMIKREGFELGLQMMIGLPGDTLDKTLYTAAELTALEPDFVRIYPTLVIRKTKLEQMFIEGKYRPLEMEEAVMWAGEAYRLFGKHEIPVIRIGLQPTNELEDDTTVVAGPYHPSFRQMVDGWLFKTSIDTYLDDLSKPFKTVQLTVHPKMRSALMGIRKQVIREIEKKYPHAKFVTMQGVTLKKDQLCILIDGSKSEVINIFDV